jgi:hypothetical protein
MADFDVVAEGTESLAQVESDVLVIEEQLSQSTVLATAAVDWQV